MSRRFPVLGTLTALAGLGCGTLLVAATRAEPTLSFVVAIRLTAGVVAALSLVAAEALWWPRRWVLRAVDTWGVASTLAPIVFAALASELRDWGAIASSVAVSAVFIGLPYVFVRQYVEVRAQRLGLLTPAPRPVLRRAP